MVEILSLLPVVNVSLFCKLVLVVSELVVKKNVVEVLVKDSPVLPLVLSKIKIENIEKKNKQV